MMKPNQIDAWVVTRRGRIPLGNVVVGDEILTHKGRYRRVTAVHEQGTLPLLKLITGHGRSNRTAMDHPYLTTKGWVQAQDLKAGDLLGAVVPAEEGMTDRITAEEARLLGYMVGDGSCTHFPTFTNTDAEMLADFQRCAKACGFSTSVRSVAPSLRKRNYNAAILGLRGALHWLEHHGVRGKSSYTHRIPPDVLASSREVVANFVGAYWSCDGQILIRHTGERGSIYFSNATTVGFDLANDLQHALLRLGINARIRNRSRKLKTKRQASEIYRYYHVQTCAHKDTVLFKNMPGLCSAKAKLVADLTPQRFVQGPLFEDEIVSIVDGGIGECRCLSVEDDHSFTAGDLASTTPCGLFTRTMAH
jgi:intein/homing endonuclease